MSRLGKLQEELLMSSLCELIAKCNLQNIPDLLVLHSVKLFDKNDPQLPRGKSASRTRNGMHLVAKSAPAHLMARSLGVKTAVARWMARFATESRKCVLG